MKKTIKTFERGETVCKIATGESFTVCHVSGNTFTLSGTYGTVCVPVCRWYEYEVLPPLFEEEEYDELKPYLINLCLFTFIQLLPVIDEVFRYGLPLFIIDWGLQLFNE